MLISQLFSDPIQTVIVLVAFLVALSVHEASHALAAFVLGDKTAYHEKRLTLNPLSHIDWTGFLMLVVVGFGWGKPVPFNPYNLKWQRVGPTLVAAAGPASNLLLALLAVFLLSLVTPALASTNGLVLFLFLLALMSLVLGIFNLIPLPPLDGSKALLALLAHPRHAKTRQWLETRGPFVLLAIVLAGTVLNINVLGWIDPLARSILLIFAGWFGV